MYLNSKKASKSNSRRLFVFLSSPLSTAPMLISVGDHQFKLWRDKQKGWIFGKTDFTLRRSILLSYGGQAIPFERDEKTPARECFHKSLPEFIFLRHAKKFILKDFTSCVLRLAAKRQSPKLFTQKTKVFLHIVTNAAK